MCTDPKIAIIGGLVSFDVGTELLPDWKCDDRIGNCNIGNANTINRIPLPICERAMIKDYAGSQLASSCYKEDNKLSVMLCDTFLKEIATSYIYLL